MHVCNSSTQEGKKGLGLLKTHTKISTKNYIYSESVSCWIMSTAGLMFFKSLHLLIKMESWGASLNGYVSTKELPYLRLRKHCRRRGRKIVKAKESGSLL